MSGIQITGAQELFASGKRASICLAGALLLALSACTTTPERIAELEQARETVQTLEMNPRAQSAASAQLRDAQAALRRAEMALENGGELDQIRHEAYLARRHAEIGLQMTSTAEAEQAISQAEARRTEVQLQARETEAQRAEQLARERAAQAERSMAEARASQSVAEAAIEEANRLAEELSQLEGELEAERTERGLVLTLGDVLFDTNRAELKPGADTSIEELANFLLENPDRRLMIEGHTDARGSDQLNRRLSEERAEAVAEALVERGVPSERLRAIGLGEDYPVASNENPAGMQQNRRVEIVVSNADGSFPETAEQRAMAARQ